GGRGAGARPAARGEQQQRHGGCEDGGSGGGHGGPLRGAPIPRGGPGGGRGSGFGPGAPPAVPHRSSVSGPSRMPPMGPRPAAALIRQTALAGPAGAG